MINEKKTYKKELISCLRFLINFLYYVFDEIFVKLLFVVMNVTFGGNYFILL